MKKKIALIVRTVPRYRRRFYELLQAAMADRGMELVLIYSRPDDRDRRRHDYAELSWARLVEHRVYRLFGTEWYWQSLGETLKDAELIVVQNDYRLLANYLLLLQQKWGGRKVAYWEPCGAAKSDLGLERCAPYLTGGVHPAGWIVGNPDRAQSLCRLGYPAERIAVVPEAIDIAGLSETRSRLDDRLLSRLRYEMGLTEEDAVCAFIGHMDAEKRIPFLLEACRLIRRAVPRFHMVFIGAGEEDVRIKRAAEQHDWIHYAGPRFESDKVPYLAVSKLLLLPGAVGLTVYDGILFRLPVVTTALTGNEPHIRSETRSCVVEGGEDVDGYAGTVIRLLQDTQAYKLAVNRICGIGPKDTVESMVESFLEGIAKAIG